MGIKLNKPDSRPLGNKGLFVLPIFGKVVVRGIMPAQQQKKKNKTYLGKDGYMKQFFNRSLALLLAVVLCFSMVPMAAFATEVDSGVSSAIEESPIESAPQDVPHKLTARCRP